jgi:hypothetical protein
MAGSLEANLGLLLVDFMRWGCSLYSVTRDCGKGLAAMAVGRRMNIRRCALVMHSVTDVQSSGLGLLCMGLRAWQQRQHGWW